MTNILQRMVEQGVELHRAGNYKKAAEIYHQILNKEPFNPGILYLLGDIAVRQGLHGLGINLLSTSHQFKPSPEACCALGCAYKAEGMLNESNHYFHEGLKISKTAELYNNLASNLSDHGQPEFALEYCAKALALEPNNESALWNKSLALLTQQNWPEAWKLHEYRYSPQVATTSHRRDVPAPIWKGQPVARLFIHGEQGIGDEIMFLSMLNEARVMATEVVVEVEPRLIELVERSFPTVAVYGNVQAVLAHEAPFDAVCAIGSLGQLYRQKDSDFPRKPYLKADPERVEYWRRQFAMQGPRPFVGVAWQGGTIGTRIQQRSIMPANLKFAKRGTAISLQYGPDAKEQAKEQGFVFYPESVGSSMDEVAAMMSACDVIVTVAQTVAHLGGALGLNVHVLTPKGSSWRYGRRAAYSMPWYGSVYLHRQETDGDWGKPLNDAKQVVDKLCREFKNADK